jgi:hypothetical protein
VLLGALVGGLTLGAAGATALAAPEPVSASALVFSAPDPAAVELAGTGSEGGDAATRTVTYLETELAYLRGADLPERVARSLTGTAPPDLEAVRVGQSNVLDITVTAPDPATAVRQTQAAVDIYVRDRQQRLFDRIDAQIAAIDGRVQAIDAALQNLGPPSSVQLDPRQRQREELSREYTEQLLMRDGVERAVAEAPQVAHPLHSAAVLPTGRLPISGLMTLGFATLGALAGAVAVALADLVAGRVRDERDVADLGVRVLSPPLPHRPPSTHSTGALERAVHLQALLLPRGAAAGGSLAVLGVDDDVDVTFTAVQHARHAARRHPTLLVCAGGRNPALDGLAVPDARTVPLQSPPHADTGGAQPTSVPGLFVAICDADPAVLHQRITAATHAGWALVVVSPPLTRSGIGMTAARRCQEVVVVAASGRSAVSDVDRTLQVLLSSGISISGVVLDPPGRVRPAELARRVPVAAEQRDGPHRAPAGMAPLDGGARAVGEPAGVGATAGDRRDGPPVRVVANGHPGRRQLEAGPSLSHRTPSPNLHHGPG